MPIVCHSQCVRAETQHGPGHGPGQRRGHVPSHHRAFAAAAHRTALQQVHRQKGGLSHCPHIHTGDRSGFSFEFFGQYTV